MLFAVVVCRYSLWVVFRSQDIGAAVPRELLILLIFHPQTLDWMGRWYLEEKQTQISMPLWYQYPSTKNNMAGYRNYITARHTFFFHMKIGWFWLHVCFLIPFHPLPGISEFCFNMRGVCRVFKITNRCGDGAQGLDVESWLSSNSGNM